MMSAGMLFGIRARLFFIMLIAVLPMAALLAYDATIDRQRALAEARADLQSLARLAAEDLETRVTGARHLLHALIEVPAVRSASAPACSDLLAGILKQARRYNNLFVIGVGGELLCSGVAAGSPVNYADTDYVRRVLESRMPAVGKPTIGRITGRAVLPVAGPMLDAHGRVEKIVAIGLRIDWFSELYARTGFLPGMVALIWNEEGRILYREPDDGKLTGTLQAGAPLFEAARRAKSTGVVEAPGLDGINRVYALTNFTALANPGLTLAFGAPTAELAAETDRSLRRNLLVLALLSAVVFALSWWTAEIYVHRPVVRLAETSGRLRAGDLKARVPGPHPGGEIGALTTGFNETAAAIEAQTESLQRTNRALRLLSECNQALVRATSEPELLQAICERIVRFGGYRFAWVGYAENDAEKSVRPVARSGFDDGYLDGSRTGWADDERGRGPTGTAIRSGKPFVVADIAGDPRFALWREAALARGYASCVALPLVGEGRAIGALNIYAAEPGAFHDEEMPLLKELADDLAYGIAALHNRAERERAQAALRKSDAQLQTVFENLGEGVAVSDLDGQLLHFNRAAIEMHGFASRDEYLRRLPEFADTFELSTLDGTMLPVDQWPLARILRGETLRDLEVSVCRIRNGWRRVFSYGGTLVRGADGQPLLAVVTIRDITERKEQELKIARLSRIHAVLSGINSTIVRVRDRQELFNEACRIAVEHGNFGIAWIGILDPAAQEVTPVAWAGFEASEYLGAEKAVIRNDTPQARGILAQAIKTRRAVFSNDITLNPEVGGRRREEAIRRGYRSVIVLPLIIEGEVVGNMSLLARELNFVTEEELKLLTELASDISFSLEHITKAEKFEKLSRIRLVSGEINAAIVRIGERETLLRETCRIAAEHGKFDLIWIGALDSEKQEVKPIAWTGFSPEAAHAVSWASISAARGTLGEAMRTRRPSVRNDIEGEVPVGKLREEALNKGCRSTVCLPLAVDDNVVALIVLFATGRGFFDADELALLSEMAADVSFALQSISRREKVEYLSYYDALTGLPNRQLFIDRVSQQMRARSGEQRMVALVLLDLDRFRNINETLGRHGGDELLKLAARRLEHVFRSRDYLAHIGADNFGVVIRGVQDAAEIAHVVESQVLACFREPFVVNDRELRVVARTGIALFPNDGGDADILFKNAEAALRNAKASDERYLFYAPPMNARVAEQLKIENQLRVAVLEEQFVLHYQPRIEFATGRICGLEALIRWMHPERGLVPPGEFIPILESTGMILEVGRWALKRAALDHAAWRAAGLKPPRIAVNVSAIQLRRKEFVENVRTAMSEAGDSGEHIDVEITESMLMDDIEGNIEKLKAVQAMGMQVAMDDFGTGYSSLSYLARLPINSLKIDRSFVSQMTRGSEQMAIVSTVILLARALNLKVVAEGVETEEQAQLLRQLKCDEAQGYLFGRPVPPKDLEGKLGQA